MRQKFKMKNMKYISEIIKRPKIGCILGLGAKKVKEKANRYNTRLSNDTEGSTVEVNKGPVGQKDLTGLLVFIHACKN